MKKLIISTVVALVMSLAVVAPMAISAPVYAAGGDTCTCKDANGNVIKDANGNPKEGHIPEAAILKDVCDCGGGEAVIHIIMLVINIMSIGIGVIGAVGITIVGIQYLTAGGNEEQTRKAKRRMFEIIIGFAAYALLYALLYFFLPNFAGTTSY